MSRRGAAVLAIVVLALVVLSVGACSSRGTAVTGDARSVPIATSTRAGSPDLALIQGTLVLDPRGCLVIAQTTILWPEGYSARRTPAGVVEVVNADGAVVARTGRLMAMGGGGTSARSGRCLADAENVFEVGDLPALAPA